MKEKMIAGIIFIAANGNLFAVPAPTPALSASSTVAVTANVPAYAMISISSGLLNLTIPSLTAGTGSVTDTSATFTASGLGAPTNFKITGQLDSNMPANSTLTVTLNSTRGTNVRNADLSNSMSSPVTLVDYKATSFSDIGQTISTTFSVLGGYNGGLTLNRTITYTVISN